MNQRVHIMLLVSLVAFMLAMAPSAAFSLGSISLRGGPTVSSSGRLTLGERNLNAERQIICEVTLLRTVGSSVAKRSGAVFGKVVGVAIRSISNECRHGNGFMSIESIAALRDAGASECRENGSNVALCNTSGGRPELWSLVYDTFLGSLPSIEGIRFHVERAQFLMRFRAAFINIGCLYEGNIGALAPVAGGAVVSNANVLLEATELVGRTLEGICPSPIRLSGRVAIEPHMTLALI